MVIHRGYWGVFLSRLMLSLLLLAIVASLGFTVLSRYLDSPLGLKQDTLIIVPSGSSLTYLSKHLAVKNIVKWPKILTMYARLTDQTGIRVGEYVLTVNDTPKTLLALLTSGKVLQYQLTFAEGLSFNDWKALLLQQPKLTQTLNDLDNQQLIKQLGLDIIHPEGWFFPDTYQYSAGTSDRDILIQAHQRMRHILTEEWQKKAEDLPFSNAYEALILASIVEKETGIEEERSEIAGVFIRRLKKGMRLQTDPTVIYGLGDDYKGNLTRKHLEQLSDYNTYKINGLPPTPIAMPGREAIHAVLHPKAGQSLYFVAKGDGSHYFSDTLNQHINAVKRYQLNRRLDYRSHPK